MEPVKDTDLSKLTPLPKELQNLPKDESLCTYCGIPYLILHEVRDLQTKNADLENRLKNYNSMKEKFTSMEDELAKAKLDLKRLEELPALKSEFGRLHDLVNNQEEQIDKLNSKISDLEGEKDDALVKAKENVNELERLKLEHEEFESEIEGFVKDLSSLKEKYKVKSEELEEVKRLLETAEKKYWNLRKDA